MCLTGVLLSLVVMGCNKQAPTAPSSNSSEAAPAAALESDQAWLALLDSGSYSKAWEVAAATMRSTMSQADFEKGMQTLRTPLGKVVSRDIKSQRHMTRSPGLPEGTYMVISYSTTFENKPNVAETVVLTLEKDGNWTVSGYSLP